MAVVDHWRPQFSARSGRDVAPKGARLALPCVVPMRTWAPVP
jgi:hypothetical protein